MRYYKHLYLAESLEKKKDKIIQKLEKNKFQLNVHLIVLPRTEKNQLEIMDSHVLLQPAYPKDDLFVIGIVPGYEDALEFIENIVQEVYADTQGTDIRNYILKKEQED